jgi:50S ribosomal protein L16 3-hydroxylase
MTPVERLEPFDPDVFLRDYWRQRPCLIRSWLSPGSLSLGELIDLAAEHDLPSRLVGGRQDRADWTLRHGPLSRADLPGRDRDWTVLVQEVDKVSAAVGNVLDNFRFLPDWVLDDIMISHAVDGGSVGAHVDAYDVFLVQAFGQRHWQLAERFDGRSDERFELALLRHWQSEFELTAEPGDALYLPAGIAHHGRAIGTCQTWSVGVRTPSGPELLFRVAEHLAGTPAGDARLEVAGTHPGHPALVSPKVLDHARDLMRRCVELDDDELSELLGQFLSGWRLWPQDPADIEVDELVGRLEAGEELKLSDGARLALSAGTDGLRLHVNGEPVNCPSELAENIAASRRVDARWSKHPTALEQLLELGALRPPSS